MRYRLPLVCTVCLVITASVLAGTPVIEERYSKPENLEVRLMDYLLVDFFAVDPDKHELTTEWRILSDPTGKAYFEPNPTAKTLVGQTTVKMAFPWVVAAATQSESNDRVNHVGEVIVVEAVARHTNPADGQETVSRTFKITIGGVNHPPVPKISGTLGTSTDRIPAGGVVVCRAADSFDPDPQDSYRSDWTLGSRSGGYFSKGIVLIGSEGGIMTFTVPPMSAPIQQEVILRLSDGMHEARASATAYLKPADGSGNPLPTNGPPTASSTSPVSATVGDTVVLTAVAQDADGDNLDFSWKFLQPDTTVSNVSVVGPSPVGSGKRWTVTANLGPLPVGTYRLRFTARETATSDHKTATTDVTVYVSEGGSGGIPGEYEETPGECGSNTPPTVTITPNPKTSTLKYKGGQPVSIVVAARDTSEFAGSLGTVTGATIDWDLSELGLTIAEPGFAVDSGDKTISRSTLAFTAPEQNRTGYITLVAEDRLGCKVTVRFSITFEPSTSNNQSPTARIRYKVGEGSYQAGPASAVSVDSPATITLDAGTSQDDGGVDSLSFSWTKTTNLSSGGVTLSPSSGKTTTLTVANGTQGSVTVNLAAVDQQSAQGATSITFNTANPSLKPTAKVTVKVGEAVVSSPVEEGSLVTLDGSESVSSDGAQNYLTFSWQQVEGPPVSLTGIQSAKASFMAPAVAADGTELRFELTVTDTRSAATAKQEGTVTLNVPATYFAQMGVGPLGDTELRTVLLLVNNTSQKATGVTVEFFNQQGGSLDPLINGEVWAKEPFEIPAQSSRRLAFTAASGEIEVGWARVRASTKLAGLVLYQIVGAEQGDVQREISVFSSTRGTSFATYFNPKEETALAVANPGDQPVRVKVKLLDYLNGEQWVVKDSVLFPELPDMRLPAKQHSAKFIDAALLGQLPTNFKEGTLLVEADSEIIVTILKTKEGVAFSTLPLASSK